METSGDDFAARLAAIRERLDHPPGVMLGVLRLPILDPILAELGRLIGDPGSEDVSRRQAEPATGPAVVAELERLADLLATGMLGASPESVQRRGLVVELLRRMDAGRLPALAADAEDPFGLELRAMLESDHDLRFALGRLYPLVLRASSPAPSARWVRAAKELSGAPDSTNLTDATTRVLAALVRAPIESRPDLLTGGVRPSNQRLARGLLWFASVALASPAETLRAVGLRMGTSGRSDAVVRDVALANTSAALLGQSTDPAAPAALASMRSHITNRNVLKQVDRALEALAAGQGIRVDELVDLSLPSFGLGPDARLEIEARGGTALLAVTDRGVEVQWRGADGTPSAGISAGLGDEDPAALAQVESTRAVIDAAIAEQRRLLENRLGSTRSWPEPIWRQRFRDHPVAGALARGLVWAIAWGDAEGESVLAEGHALIDASEHPVAVPSGAARLWIWHPADATPQEVAAWRATLAVRAVQQPFKQVDREVFRVAPEPAPPNADLRFAGRLVEHARLRALLRERGWAMPALGAWDQGDEATGWRAFDEGLRAELRYQLPERVPTGTRIEHARLVAVRFVRTDAPPAAPATGEVAVPLSAVPPRAFSEALRDVSLSVVVGERGPLP